MLEAKTYEELLTEALAGISADIDKRVGSMAYNGVAPAMAELAKLYSDLVDVFNATYVATAPREYLILRAADWGVVPNPATPSVRVGRFDIAIDEGTRFSREDLDFYTGDFIESDESGYYYRMICETPGVISNAGKYSGSLVPIDYVDGLKIAELGEIIVAGEDEEDTEVFRARVQGVMQSQAFGGNREDYKNKVLEFAGISGVKVIPVWNGDIRPSDFVPPETVADWIDDGMTGISDQTIKDWITSVFTAAADGKLTVGGAVKVVLLSSNKDAPSGALVADVQEALDPAGYRGEGMGIAPIGHVVTAQAVTETTVNITTSIEFKPGYDFDGLKSRIEAAIDAYFIDLIDTWADSDYLTVRISPLESAILSSCRDAITDITGTTLNGSASNLRLDAEAIPMRGILTNNV